MPAYTITPEDILFFRDGRPMETAGGHGARWPEPSVIFDALHAALHRAFPAERREQFQAWEHSHHCGKNGHYPERNDDSKRMQRFGSLATVGPFPALVGQTSGLPVLAGSDRPPSERSSPEPSGRRPDPRWLFPRPQDVTAQDALSPTLLPMQHASGTSDLPLRFPIGSTKQPSKEEPLPWWTKEAIEAYLHGSQVPSAPWAFGDDALFAREWHTGIAIDPATQTTGHGEAAGKIYTAQYLRLRDGVTMGIHATMPMKNGQPDKREERITELFPVHHTLILGGQQRVCQVEEIQTAGQSAPLDKLLPVSPPITGERVKWLLLSPAVFPAIKAEPAKGITAHPGGWLPNWVAPLDDFLASRGDAPEPVNAGQVLLKADPPRGPGESREAWRKRVRSAPFLDCHLVAARIPKPIVLTGWTERLHLAAHEKAGNGESLKHGPRPTLLAVPAGAVYYFEGRDAPRLGEALAWHGTRRENISTINNRRSTLMGEKGFGLGVCGTWRFYDSD
jgi:hypothetical protein